METKPFKSEGLKYTQFLKPEEISVEMCWRLFAKMVFDGVTVGGVQYQETKRAFASGFFEAFKVMNDVATDFNEDQANEIMTRIYEESKVFLVTELEKLGHVYDKMK